MLRDDVPMMNCFVARTEAIIGIAVGASLFLVGLVAFALLWYFAEKLGITCLTGSGPKRRTSPKPGTKVQPASVTMVTTSKCECGKGCGGYIYSRSLDLFETTPF